MIVMELDVKEVLTECISYSGKKSEGICCDLLQDFGLDI